MENNEVEIRRRKESIKKNEMKFREEHKQQAEQSQDIHLKSSKGKVEINAKEKQDNLRGSWVDGNSVINDYYHQRNSANNHDEARTESPAMQKYKEHQVKVKNEIKNQQKEQEQLKVKNPISTKESKNIGHSR